MRTVSIHLICIALATFLSGTLHAALEFKRDFNLPTEERFTYPPSQGMPFEVLDCGISGWGDTGLLRITHGANHGTENTGGILLDIVEPTTRYLSASFSKLTLGNVTGDTLSQELLSTLKFSADLKIPSGRALEIHLHPELPPRRRPQDSDLRPQAWPSRLILGRFNGTGEFKTVSVSGTSLTPDGLTRFTKIMHDAALNDNPNVSFSLTLYFGARDGWQKGDTVHLDNLSLQIGR